MTKLTTNAENRPAIPKEDAALYRLFALIAFAIAGFTGLIVIGKNEGQCWDLLANGWFKAGMLVLFAAAVTVVVLSYLGKLRIGTNVFSLSGICKIAAPVFLLFATYTNFTNANVKAKIILVAIVFLAFIANIYPINYYRFSGAVLICAAAMYYLGNRYSSFSGKLVDNVLKYLSYPLAFIAPLFVLAVLIYAEKNDGSIKIKGVRIIRVSDKTTFYGMIALVAAAVVFSVIILVIPAAFMPLIIAFGALYAVLGIICTIKLL